MKKTMEKTEFLIIPIIAILFVSWLFYKAGEKRRKEIERQEFFKTGNFTK